MFFVYFYKIENQKTYMIKSRTQKILSLFFLSIFFVKMAISVAPLIISHCDSKTVNAVIMQLEIENHKAEDDNVKDPLLKEYLNTNFDFCFLNPYAHLKPVSEFLKEEKHTILFYPPVPTPPPNV